MEQNQQDIQGILKEHDLLRLFDELTLKQKFKKVLYGLHQPKESGDYKYARLQLLRLTAPVSAFVVPVLTVFLLLALGGAKSDADREIQVQIMEPEALKELDKPEELKKEVLQLDTPNLVESDVMPDVVLPDQPITDTQTALSPIPAKFDAVALVKSPVIMKGIYGSRSPGARGKAIAEYGGGYGVKGETENAVLRALRWLKKYQAENGSWPIHPAGVDSPGEPPKAGGGHPMAMTGLALLTYLAHGETPESPEFGPTVEKAIRYLLQTQGGNGRWESSYTHAIATYAMCEAYALTRIPMVKDSAERALIEVVRGQNLSGGWNYPLAPCERDDTSVMGWCAQALKAGKMGGMKVEGLDECMKKAIEGFKKNSSPNGGFGYATTDKPHPSPTGLSGVGVLCMQLLGASDQAECRQGLVFLETSYPFLWQKVAWNNIYYWYYITQAKFHAGGKTWNVWNKAFAPQLVKSQIVLEKQGIDDKDIGYWVAETGTQGATMDTTLCALQLQVYYRYLPTYKAEAAKAESPATDLVSGDGEVDIQIKL